MQNNKGSAPLLTAMLVLTGFVVLLVGYGSSLLQARTATISFDAGHTIGTSNQAIIGLHAADLDKIGRAHV